MEKELDTLSRYKRQLENTNSRLESELQETKKLMASRDQVSKGSLFSSPPLNNNNNNSPELSKEATSRYFESFFRRRKIAFKKQLARVNKQQRGKNKPKTSKDG